MNHLRDLLDSLKVKVETPEDSPLTLDDMDRIALLSEALGERAVCFSMGNIETTLELQVIPELIRLPYSTCWFEADIYPPSEPELMMTGGLLVHRDEGGQCNGFIWTKLRGNWRLICRISGWEGNHASWVADNRNKDMGLAAHFISRASFAFLSALHCSNVLRKEHAPDAKLQKARSKRGKAPLFSYWTLSLDGQSDHGKDNGGTHASPRVHLRRGHPRQYAHGKWTWVQAHAVGNRALGIVHKDYSARTLLAAAANG